MAIDITNEDLLTIDQLTAKLGVVRRTLEVKRAKGEFPEPTTYVFGSPRWSSTVINAWLEQQKQKSLQGLIKRLSNPFVPVKGPVTPSSGMPD